MKKISFHSMLRYTILMFILILGFFYLSMPIIFVYGFTSTPTMDELSSPSSLYYNDAKENPSATGQLYISIKDIDTNRLLEGGNYQINSLTKGRDGNWIEDTYTFHMNTTGDSIITMSEIINYPYGYTDPLGENPSNLFVLTEISPPSGYESNPFILVIVPSKDGWKIKSYQKSDIGKYFPIENDTRTYDQSLNGFVIPYKKSPNTMISDSPNNSINNLLLSDITVNRGPFDNNELVNQAVKDTSLTPDIVASSTFSTINAATFESTPGATITMAHFNPKYGVGVGFVRNTVSKYFDNTILENYAQEYFNGTDISGNTTSQFVIYEKSAPSGYHLNPITRVMVGDKDGYHIKSYYNGTGDIAYYHPVILDTTVGSGEYFYGNNPPQFLIPHTKIIDDKQKKDLQNSYVYSEPIVQSITYENATNPSVYDFDKYFIHGDLNTTQIVTTNDLFTKENIGGSVFRYTTFLKEADGSWKVIETGILDINTSGTSFSENVGLTRNMRIVLEEVVPPRGYVKNPIILTVSTSENDYTEWSVNYFKSSQGNGYYFNPEVSEANGSLIIPHIIENTLPDIIDVTDPSTPTPNGYVRVTFSAGDNGVLNSGDVSIYDVKSGVSLPAEKAPGVVPNVGFTFAGWDQTLPKVITEATTITATYNTLPDIIDVTDPSTPTPNGYVRVTFSAEANGVLEAGKVYIYDVKVGTELPAEKAPGVVPNVGFTFVGWDHTLPMVITEATTIKATYNTLPDIIDVTDPSTPTPNGYLPETGEISNSHLYIIGIFMILISLLEIWRNKKKYTD